MEKQSTGGGKKRERERRLEKSAYSEEYRRFRTERMLRYFQEKNKEQKLRIIARFRLGNEWKASRYWTREEKKSCRLCETERETGIPVMKECKYSWTDKRIEERQGIEWMKRVKGEKKEEFVR